MMAESSSLRPAMTTSRRHKWSLNFTTRGKSEKAELPSPPGYSASISVVHGDDRQGTDPGLVAKRSWDIALGPIKQIPMNVFIMWMAGNTVSIFPIMMVGMTFFRPFKAFFQLSATFKLIEGDQHILQKLVYILGNIGCILIALYKCQSMGLLPTHPSDWLEFLDPPERMEFSGGGIIL